MDTLSIKVEQFDKSKGDVETRMDNTEQSIQSTQPPNIDELLKKCIGARTKELSQTSTHKKNLLIFDLSESNDLNTSPKDSDETKIKGLLHTLTPTSSIAFTQTHRIG